MHGGHRVADAAVARRFTAQLLAGEPASGVAHVARRLLAIQAQDPLLHGWVDREPILGRNEHRVIAQGMFRPFALVDGRAAAGWRIRGGDVDLEPFRRLRASERTALRADAADVLRFLELGPTAG